MHLLLYFFLLTNVRAQQHSCLCSCCRNLSCNLIPLPPIYVQTCTLLSCLAQCQATYPKCRENYPYNLISAQCNSTTIPSFGCRCDCCNTGFPSCSPSYVGNSLAFVCNIHSCSISCATQYPNLCSVNHHGQAQGTCSGLVTIPSTLTTTSVVTTVDPWLGNTCSCKCCQTGFHCLPTYVGITSAYQCSSGACTQACQRRYPLSCPSLSNYGQVNGTCVSGTSGNTICRCGCCSTNGCINYDISIHGNCAMCNSVCRQQSPCTKPDQVTQTCYTNKAKLPLPWLIFILTMNFSTLLITN
ncbi:unnamed protein product [Rotaria sp. Silwood2]|nr:unnamed protein product [Rotaria sp. Silwood2]CAF4470153.1 unnamed protein product [Rotaria sp. Silwood2]CAF4514135.1 unnamed protein product [Rotaria sp. Silwood2]